MLLSRAGVHAVATLGLAGLLAPVAAGASPIQWTTASGGNDHYYEFVQVVFDFSTTSPDWAANTLAAAAAAAAGTGGYLATVGSAGENVFLFGLTTSLGFTGFKGSWLDASGSTFTPWGGVEPNNGGAAAYMHIGTGVFGGIDPAEWADDSGTIGTPDATLDPVIGYFVEYDRLPDTVVPEPATLTLLALGLTGARVLRHRRRAAR